MAISARQRRWMLCHRQASCTNITASSDLYADVKFWTFFDIQGGVDLYANGLVHEYHVK